jgi:hypothetical protein
MDDLSHGPRLGEAVQLRVCVPGNREALGIHKLGPDTRRDIFHQGGALLERIRRTADAGQQALQGCGKFRSVRPLHQRTLRERQDRRRCLSRGLLLFPVETGSAMRRTRAHWIEQREEHVSLLDILSPPNLPGRELPSCQLVLLEVVRHVMRHKTLELTMLSLPGKQGSRFAAAVAATWNHPFIRYVSSERALLAAFS